MRYLTFTILSRLRSTNTKSATDSSSEYSKPLVHRDFLKTPVAYYASGLSLRGCTCLLQIWISYTPQTGSTREARQPWTSPTGV
jgi:hypothetical protein